METILGRIAQLLDEISRTTRSCENLFCGTTASDIYRIRVEEAEREARECMGLLYDTLEMHEDRGSKEQSPTELVIE